MHLETYLCLIPMVRLESTYSYRLNYQIPHQDTTSLADLGSTIKNNWFGTAAKIVKSNGANLLDCKTTSISLCTIRKQSAIANQGSAGVADLPGMNISATFGNNWAVDRVINHSAGSRTEQAFNLMHELGHNLGLRHGGNDNTNCKPNYLSVMSDLFSLGQLVSNAPLDYSRSALATLNKGSLSN